MVRDSTILFAATGAMIIAFAFLLAGVSDANIPGSGDIRPSYIGSLVIMGGASIGFLIGAIKQFSKEDRN